MSLIQGYNIEIDETEDGINVKASKDDEVMEEFTLELGEETEGSEEEFETEEGSEESQELPDEEETEEAPEAPEAQMESVKVKSFAAFVKNRK